MVHWGEFGSVPWATESVKKYLVLTVANSVGCALNLNILANLRFSLKSICSMNQDSWWFLLSEKKSEVKNSHATIP
jgi:hypothetical protein